MKRPSLEVLEDGLREWMILHPGLSARLLLGALLVAVVGMGLFLGLAVAVLVTFAWVVSREMAVVMGILTLLLWLFSAALLFTLRNTDAAYSRRLKRWMGKAEEGDPGSRWKLVDAYRTGIHGVRKDPAALCWWLRKLAEAGDVRAMRELAILLQSGQGLIRDRVQARLWLERAIERGDSGAGELLAEWNHSSEGGLTGSGTE